MILIRLTRPDTSAVFINADEIQSFAEAPPDTAAKPGLTRVTFRSRGQQDVAETPEQVAAALGFAG
jgi:hypothetical protein